MTAEFSDFCGPATVKFLGSGLADSIIMLRTELEAVNTLGCESEQWPPRLYRILHGDHSTLNCRSLLISASPNAGPGFAESVQKPAPPL